MVILAILPLCACIPEDATESAPALDREGFIQVIVELREAERAVAESDSASELFQHRKEEILARHGTTEEEVRAYADAAATDLREFTETWEEISNRLRRPLEPDTAAAGEEGASPRSDTTIPLPGSDPVRFRD